MSIYSEVNPIHNNPQWIKPIAYKTSVADPPKLPKLVWLRSSCRHIIGVGYVWKTQGFIAWKQCR